jgi:hypothetical protein
MKIDLAIKINGSNDFLGKLELYTLYKHSYAIYECGKI